MYKNLSIRLIQVLDLKKSIMTLFLFTSGKKLGCEENVVETQGNIYFASGFMKLVQNVFQHRIFSKIDKNDNSGL